MNYNLKFPLFHNLITFFLILLSYTLRGSNSFYWQDSLLVISDSELLIWENKKNSGDCIPKKFYRFEYWLHYGNILLDEQLPLEKTKLYAISVEYNFSRKIGLELELGTSKLDDWSIPLDRIILGNLNLFFQLYNKKKTNNRVTYFVILGGGGAFYPEITDQSSQSIGYHANFGGGLKFTAAYKWELRIDLKGSWAFKAFDQKGGFLNCYPSVGATFHFARKNGISFK